MPEGDTEVITKSFRPDIFDSIRTRLRQKVKSMDHLEKINGIKELRLCTIVFEGNIKNVENNLKGNKSITVYYTGIASYSFYNGLAEYLFQKGVLNKSYGEDEVTVNKWDRETEKDREHKLFKFRILEYNDLWVNLKIYREKIEERD